MKVNEKVLEKIKGAPAKPGVYMFRGKRGYLYIGKAKSLRDRLSSYLSSSSGPRISRVLKYAVDLEYFVTSSDAEALLLEANFIKRYQPRYNVRLKDDKKYPYLKITVGETYPRIYPTRDLRDDGSVLFGPYASAGAMRKTLRTVRKLFPLRTCKYKLPSKRKISPCIDYYIGKCLGPCLPGFPVDEYRKAVEGLVEFLSGKTERVIKRLEEEMKEAARKLEFEKAAFIRDQLIAVREMLRDQSVVMPGRGNKDVVAIAVGGRIALALILQVRGGKVVGKEHFVLNSGGEEDEKEIARAFINLYYTSSALPAEEIVLRPLPEEAALLEALLAERTGKKVILREPTRDELSLYEMARGNAARLLEEEMALRGTAHLYPPSLLDLQRVLELPRVPLRIEAVDISQLFGKNPVGSVVVFLRGRPAKSEYRRFRIKEVKGIDDFSMIEEVVRRRLRRLKEEGKSYPDLFLIDGGAGQLGRALRAASEVGAEDIAFVAIAKRFDELYLPDGRRVMLSRRSQALRLLQRVRDEAHRFAVSYHRNLRRKEGLLSFLDGIPGLGEKRKMALLNYFGSVSRLLSASKEEIAKIEGFGPKTAERLYSLLHPD